MYEILLTRIFSVTMWYHFAFLAISLAMFGMTIGGILVYLHPPYSRQDQALRQMARSSFLFAVWIVIGFFTHVFVPFIPGVSLKAIASMSVTFAALSVAFVYSGICVCLALTKFPYQVSRLYAADLAGAASGCVLLICIFKITDALSAVIIAALLASLASLLFAHQGHQPRLRRAALTFSVLLAAVIIVDTIGAEKGSPMLQVMWVKGEFEATPLYEKWNAISRLTVFGDPNGAMSPLTEGTSPTYPNDRGVRALHLTIDASAETTMTAFSGDFTAVNHLTYDVKEIVYYLRQRSKVLIVGAGGGRDILAALALGQKSVRAVELNQDILATVNGRFGDFTGHLDRDPRVSFVNDEARSYLARTNEQFDIIQASFIDTWAATAAGAFALTENGLYTVEAWDLFLRRLSPNGTMSFSRWYMPGQPIEAYRLTALGVASLQRLGVVDPRQHIILVRNTPRRDLQQQAMLGAATILISKTPFSNGDLDKIDAVVRRMQYKTVLSPRTAEDPTFAALGSGHAIGEFVAGFQWDISAPTDDRPFFFQVGKLRDMFRRTPRISAPHTDAVHLLGVMLIIITSLTACCVVIPLYMAGEKLGPRTALPHVFFFGAIGLGYLLIEVSQMQRLIIFLGHPTYSLSVVLFTLLLASGLGSYTTRGIVWDTLRRSGAARLGLLVVLLCSFGLLTPRVLSSYQNSVTTTRILIAAGILFPVGFLMGMAFPLGMKAASKYGSTLTPWLWGINGASSVCASVLAVVVSMYSGISTAYWIGFGCYALAWIVFVWSSWDIGRRRAKGPATSEAYGSGQWQEY